MLQIPKNVMQIGEVNPHTKIYMEDYVHTFLERRKKAEEYLAFGKKEERDNVLYYLIYGVEKRTDWDRGSYPYFKNFERIGVIEGLVEKRVFRPVRGSGITLDGYFIFYEQNEDMQSYMIVVNEAEETAGSEEKEEVMEAVKTHKEQRKKEQEAAGANAGKRPEESPHAAWRKEAKPFPEAARTKSVEGIMQSLQKRAKKNAVSVFGRKEKNAGSRQPVRAPRTPRAHTWTIPDLCRAGSMLLLLLLVVMGLTSINQYPDMKAMTELFSGAAKAVSGEDDEAVLVDAKPQEDGLIVEETTVEPEGSARVEEAVMDETESEGNLALAEDTDGAVQWMIGQKTTQDASEEDGLQPEMSKENPESSETAWADARRPENDVQKEEIQDETDAADDTLEESEAQPSGESSPEEGGTAHAEEESVTQAIARPVSYVVKKGDNLAGIARKFYGNASMVKEICNLNQIEDPDQIRPGQNILLP